jgi:hypothetical protein
LGVVEERSNKFLNAFDAVNGKWVG